ncbi:hypothetical protein SSX86_010666 [Deinandra increscens subsp. villosa]|uniref:Uncharacterized protein n=1 Tax=Deinandra increscens subsp. villosa TaxID=3103831 RepID=A0AAP0D9D1_9ASTR
MANRLIGLASSTAYSLQINGEQRSEHKEEEETTVAAEDEDTGALEVPIVSLEEVAVSTGEDDEDTILLGFWFQFRAVGRNHRALFHILFVESDIIQDGDR